MAEDYPDVQLLIDGRWRAGAGGRTIPIINPATEEVIGQVAQAEIADLDLALAAAKKGFAIWRDVSAFERGKVLRRAGELLRERGERIAFLMTREQGKPLAEARIEVLAAADTLDWFAEEGRRAYGRIVPARAPNITNLVLKEPVGPVAA
ncbi:MAG: aldehyde dehydrogenase family protein, partial [Rhodobacterales bacterium]|nr:aldehyde dehydrogenase family protein [Rhodobacterales bacterium]